MEEQAKMKLKNHVVVGVKAWDQMNAAEKTGQWAGSIGAHFVTVDGVEVPGVVVSASSKMDSEGFQTAVIEVICGKFETVPSPKVHELPRMQEILTTKRLKGVGYCTIHEQLADHADFGDEKACHIEPIDIEFADPVAADQSLK